MFRSKSFLPQNFLLKLNPGGFIPVPGSFVCTSESKNLFPLYLDFHPNPTSFSKNLCFDLNELWIGVFKFWPGWTANIFLLQSMFNSNYPLFLSPVQLHFSLSTPVQQIIKRWWNHMKWLHWRHFTGSSKNGSECATKKPRRLSRFPGDEGHAIAGIWEVAHSGENICLMNKCPSAMLVKYRMLPK